MFEIDIDKINHKIDENAKFLNKNYKRIEKPTMIDLLDNNFGYADGNMVAKFVFNKIKEGNKNLKTKEDFFKHMDLELKNLSTYVNFYFLPVQEMMELRVGEAFNNNIENKLIETLVNELLENKFELAVVNNNNSAKSNIDNFIYTKDKNEILNNLINTKNSDSKVLLYKSSDIDMDYIYINYNKGVDTIDYINSRNQLPMKKTLGLIEYLKEYGDFPKENEDNQNTNIKDIIYDFIEDSEYFPKNISPESQVFNNLKERDDFINLHCIAMDVLYSTIESDNNFKYKEDVMSFIENKYKRFNYNKDEKNEVMKKIDNIINKALQYNSTNLIIDDLLAHDYNVSLNNKNTNNNIYCVKSKKTIMKNVLLSDYNEIYLTKGNDDPKNNIDILLSYNEYGSVNITCDDKYKCVLNNSLNKLKQIDNFLGFNIDNKLDDVEVVNSNNKEINFKQSMKI